MSKHEKNKSGGLLESWFGRPKTRGSGYSTPSGRPTSTDGDAPELQDLEKMIRSLTESEVETKFMEILEDMNIPKDKREPLLSKPILDRRKMIYMHLKGEIIRFVIDDDEH